MRCGAARLAWLAAIGLVALGLSPAARAVTSSRFCDRPAQISAAEQDRLLRFAAVVKQTLDRSDRSVALIARSGMDLSRFGVRYSHAGISLKASPNGAWSVRQLYYACDESRPRLFDQGMAGFLIGTDDPSTGYASIVLLPQAEGEALARTSLDPRLALELLGADYSANAYAYSTRYQNCNQWVMELIASAWGQLDPARPAREEAQRWLQAQGYAPAAVDVGSHALMFAAQFVPLIHVTDHPTDDLYAMKLRISMPSSIEAFVRARLPQAQRVELCHDDRHIVVRRGWQPLGPGCQAAPGDEVIAFD
ncbi:MAG TPA: DUF2145 domain-containing protein [Burkholderiaceae bacterium]|nr:DUF2145 domain-containing protein [Burkholderiaceae bacterium]